MASEARGILLMVFLGIVGLCGWTVYQSQKHDSFGPPLRDSAVTDNAARSDGPNEAAVGASDAGGPVSNLTMKHVGSGYVISGTITNDFQDQDWHCLSGKFVLIGQQTISPDYDNSGCTSTTVAPGTSTTFVMGFMPASASVVSRLRIETKYHEYAYFDLPQ